jgi:predicted ATPase/transcriptional regulator with XRE-family HTH domain
MGQSRSQSGSFGALLRSYRRAAGMSQESLAEAAGLSVNGVGSLERGTRQLPYPDTVRRLADALDLSQNQRAALFQALPDPIETQPLQDSSHPRTNLRPDPSSFVGRDEVIDALTGVLTGPHRLVTLTGPGGVGKTRIATELGRFRLDDFHNGVWLIDLAPVRDPDRALDALADQIAPLIGTRVDRTRLASAIDATQRLLILDNTEQIPGFPEAISGLLGETKHMRFLVTSRTPLQVRDERVVSIHPLFDSLAGASRGGTGLESAIALFVDRVKAHLPALELTDGNREIIAAICRETDGLPLAIELAAARARTLPLTVLLAQLQEGLDALSRGMRDIPERQQTMRSTIAWSVNLLTAEQREVFAILAVFRGGCTFGDAEQVVHAVWPSRHLAFADLLSDLVDAGLVMIVRGEDSQQDRLRMLVPIHAFASEVLTDERRAEVRRYHAELYWRMAVEAGDSGPRALPLMWLPNLMAEQHNLHAAIESLLDDGHLNQVVGIIWALWRFWWLGGMQESANRWLGQIVATAAADPETVDNWHLGQALVAHGSFVWALGDDRAAADMLARGVGVARRAGDDYAGAIGEMLLGVISIRSGHLDDADALLQSALARPVAETDDWLQSMVLAYRGVLAMLRKHFGDAEHHLATALRLAREIGDPTAMSEPLYYLALLSFARGEPRTAGTFLVEGLDIASTVGEPVLLAYYLKTIAQNAVAEDDQAGAITQAADRVLTDHGAPWYLEHLSHALEVSAPSAPQGHRGRQNSSPDWTLDEAVQASRAALKALGLPPTTPA